MGFADHLLSWSQDDLRRLMEARPDLLPASDRGVEAVARKAGTAISLGRVLVGADVGMLVVAEALAATSPATVAEIDELLGTGDPDAVIDAVERLRRNGVVVVEDGVISPVGALADLLHRPLGLGPSFAELAEHLPQTTIDRLTEATAADGATSRSATARAIAHRLRDPATIDRLLAEAEPEVRDLLDELVARRSPAITLPAGYSYRNPNGDDPLSWLIQAGLVVPVTESGAELPRELVIAAAVDGLAPAAMLRPIPITPVDGLAADRVDGSAAERANRLIDGVETLLRIAERGEISVRKAGGIGPRELKRLAAVTDRDVVEIARLIELLAAARLIRVTAGTLVTTDLAPRWWSLARTRRYLALVRAWMATDRFLSRGLAETPEPSKMTALGDTEPVAAAAAGRLEVLESACQLPAGTAFDPDQLTASVVWRGPNLWGAGEPPPEDLVDWTLAEAELLGLIAANAPGPIVRAAVGGDETELDRVTIEAIAADQETFVLQSDLTAVAFGPLAPSVGRSLGEMTERVGGEAGAVPGHRFTEASIRAAFDRGWTEETITGFLTTHALSGVPQPLTYLVADVARRHGTLRVVPAQSVLITADEVGAVEVASHRKASTLGLRLIAPTVLTSPLDPVTVSDRLRDLGFFPTVDGGTVTIDGAGQHGGGDQALADVPADWTGPPLPAGPFRDEIDDAVALLLDSERPPTTDQANGDQAGSNGGGVPNRLTAFWGRAVILDVERDGGLETVRGTVVGLGAQVSLLTTDRVIEIPVASVLAVDDPTS